MEFWLVFYKKQTGRSGVSYEEAVEEALCFGWIDGIVKRLDDDRYAQRFSPRTSAAPGPSPTGDGWRRIHFAGAFGDAPCLRDRIEIEE